jgi:hypothetical protein
MNGDVYPEWNRLISIIAGINSIVSPQRRPIDRACRTRRTSHLTAHPAVDRTPLSTRTPLVSFPGLARISRLGLSACLGEEQTATGICRTSPLPGSLQFRTLLSHLGPELLPVAWLSTFPLGPQTNPNPIPTSA